MKKPLPTASTRIAVTNRRCRPTGGNPSRDSIATSSRTAATSTNGFRGVRLKAAGISCDQPARGIAFIASSDTWSDGM